MEKKISIEEKANQRTKNKDAKEVVAAYYNKHGELYEKWAYAEGVSSPRQDWLREFIQRLEQTRSGSGSGSGTGATRLRVLELGCGTGEPCTRMMLEAGIDVTAVDISSGMIEIARRRLSSFMQTTTTTTTASTATAMPDFSAAAAEEKAEKTSGSSSSGSGDVELICRDMATPLADKQEEEWRGRFDGVVAFYSLIHVPRDEMSALWAAIARWLKPFPSGLVMCNFSDSDAADDRASNWLNAGNEMYWSSWSAAKNRLLLEQHAYVEILQTEDIVDDEDGVEVTFCWVLAQKRKEPHS